MAILGLMLFLGSFIAIGLALGQPIGKMMTKGTTKAPPPGAFCLGLPIGALMMIAGVWCWFQVPSTNSQTGQPEDSVTTMNMADYDMDPTGGGNAQ